MKKNTLHILIAILTISQVTSIIKVNNLQRKIENSNAEMNNLSNTIRNDMNHIYSNVDEMLNQKVRLIESATTEIGTLDVDELTVPITFTLTPKEVSEHTAVSLDFQGELFPMEKNGTTFFATISVNIFSDVFPKIVIDENGIKKTTEDKQIGIRSIKERLFPTIYPSLVGEGGFDGKTYRRKGKLILETEGVESEIKYTEMRFAIKVDDKLISDEIIPPKSLYSGYEVDEKIPLSSGQICIMSVIATDSIGFEHHYIVDYRSADSGPQRVTRFGDEHIYSADRKLLWKLE